MNKIINWTIGSFFRTIGRIIAYIGIGIVITYILSNSNINWGGITDLFFDKVSALSYTQEITQVGDTYLDWNNFVNTGWTNSNGIYIKPINSLTTATVQSIDIELINPLNSKTVDYVAMPFIISPPSAQSQQGAINNVICEEWQNVNNNWNCVSFTNNGSTVNFPYMSELSNLQFQFRVEYENDDGSWGGWNTCDIENNMIMCPTNRKKINWFNIKYLMYNSSSTIYTRIGIGPGLRFYNKSSPTQAIEQQTQQQQQQHEEMMDDNTTQAESEATDFFEDFDAPDIGGLGAIITAPLNTIRGLLNSSCTNLVLPLPFVNENLTLPCMNTIYTQHFGAFFSIYQTIILAIIAYRCIRSIFFDIHGFTNPNDDRIEVMDL